MILSIGFSKFTDSNLLIEAGHIKTSMTGNASFPDPSPALTVLESRITAFNTALQNMGIVPNARAIKDNARKELIEVLVKLGLYVEVVAYNDEIIAASSGFKLRKKPQPIGILSKGENFKVAPGPVKGSVKLSLTKISGANAYNFQFRKKAETVDDSWKDKGSTSANIVIDELISGEEYSFRAAGIGSSPTRVYTDEISSFIL